MLSYSDFINLLHYLWEKNVLNDEEKKTVEGKTTREDKARCLIDTVMGKGATAKICFIWHLQPTLQQQVALP
uniref:CARD domain-containing protein n=1 Tax=Gadus morhua TaxID=8049 RepID=A0A8C5AWE3_GADMO